MWFENEESTDKRESLNLWEIAALEVDEEVKVRNGLEILTPSKLLNKLPISFGTNKNWKQFVQIEKWNQANTISFLLAQ